MTILTEGTDITPLERATEAVTTGLSDLITISHIEHKLAAPRNGVAFTEQQFRRLLALYFHDRTVQQWCQILGIPDASDPEDKPDHGGEA